MTSTSQQAYASTGRQHSRQKTVIMTFGINSRQIVPSPVRTLPSSSIPLPQSLYTERSPRYDPSSPSSSKGTHSFAQRQAHKPRIPSKLFVPPIRTDICPSDSDTSFQTQDIRFDSRGYPSALTSPTNSDSSKLPDIEEWRDSSLENASKQALFYLATRLDTESRRLEAVWQETGKRWKDKHGMALPRSQHASFRRRIEDGVDIKNDSPIDKEWRNIWLHANHSWSDVESSSFKSSDISRVEVPSSTITSNAVAYNNRSCFPSPTDTRTAHQISERHASFPVVKEDTEPEREPAALFRHIERLIDSIENDDGPSLSLPKSVPLQHAHERRREKNQQRKPKDAVQLLVQSRSMRRHGDNEWTKSKNGQRGVNLDREHDSTMHSPVNPVSTQLLVPRRHRVDKHKSREKQRTEEARRDEAAEHRDHRDGVLSRERPKRHRAKKSFTDSSETSRQPSRKVSDLDYWNSYETRWIALAGAEETQLLGFQDIPWPLLYTPTGSESITPQSVGAFLLSPLHSQGKSREERLSDAMLRWEPNGFEGRWISRIKERERPKIKEAVAAVYGSLVRLMNGKTSSDSQVGSVSTPVPREPAKVAVTIGKRMSAREIITHLVERGCQDLTKSLDLSTFDECPTSHGGYSDVYHGRLLTGQNTIAVKALRLSIGSFENIKHLKRAARELYTWSNCKHPNVLQLFGLAMFRGRIGMVSPWMNHGTLPQYLDSHPEVDRYSLCVQICDGLAYLHDVGIVHGDLKGANVLTLADGTPVLTDFGNSTFAGRGLLFTETTRDSGLTGRWAAPELLEGPGKPSKAADVYALGMTMLEVITGKLPYSGKGDLAVLKLVSDKKHPDRPNEHIPESRGGNKFWRLLEKCWAYESKKRPSAAKVTTNMRSITPQGLKPADICSK